MIRFFFRWAFRVVLLAAVLVIGLLLLKDNLFRSWAERRLRSSTGFDAKVGKVQVNLLEPRFTVEDLVLYSPPAFGGTPLIDAPDIRAEYLPGQAALGRFHFTFVRLEIRELNIVQSQGRTNLLEILSRIAPVAAVSPPPAKTSKSGFTGIDLLNLSIGKVRFTDLDRPRRNQEINLGLENYIVRDVRSEEDFANLLLKLIFRAGFTIYVDEPPGRAHRLN